VTDAQVEAAARALQRFNAPRVANDVQAWEHTSQAERNRWVAQARLALAAADNEVTETPAPVAGG